MRSAPSPCTPGQKRPLPLWRWAALLGFALLAPAALPAGGADLNAPAVRRRLGSSEPWLSEGETLRVAPASQAPVLRPIERGMPVRVLRRWLSPSGRPWLQVEVVSAAGRPGRGWLPG